ncbi:MAG: zf-HC2 domain-containing protein [Vicinamibacteria bacterium]
MTNAVACLDPETIAAYLDGRLDAAARARAEEHLADCEECRTLLGETAAFLQDDAAARPARTRARTPWLLGLAAAATLLVAAGAWFAPRLAATPQTALGELDRALGGKRYVESRLSGFGYGEYVSPKRGAAPVASLPLEALAAGGKVERLASGNSSASSLAALGASQVALQLVDAAVENLEGAARLEPKNARIQSDLAAAYLARSRAGGHPEDRARAAEAAATAVAIDPKSQAAAFNRALALEALDLRTEAVGAWHAYLGLDPASRWAAEARAHVEELSSRP